MKPNCHNSFATRSRRRGFSLVEMMVAVSLLLIIVVGLFAMFSQAQRALKSASTQVDVMEPGRATMEFASRDLQEMTACNSPNGTNFYIINRTVSNPLRQPLPGSASRENEMDEFFCLSRYNDQWHGAGYRVDHPETGVGTLYRYLIIRTNAPAFDPAWLALSFRTNRIFLANGTVNPDFHRVLDGVLHLKLFPYRASGEFYCPGDQDVTNRFVLNGPGIVILSDGSSCTSFTSFTCLNSRLPAYLDVELGVLEPNVLSHFKVQPAALQRTFLESKAGQVHLFRQRIPIRTAQ